MSNINKKIRDSKCSVRGVAGAVGVASDALRPLLMEVCLVENMGAADHLSMEFPSLQFYALCHHGSSQQGWNMLYVRIDDLNSWSSLKERAEDIRRMRSIITAYQVGAFNAKSGA